MSDEKVLTVSAKWRCLPFSELTMFKLYSAELHALSRGKSMKFYVDYGLAGKEAKPCLMVYETMRADGAGTPVYNAVYIVSGMPEFEFENGSYAGMLMLAKAEGDCLWERKEEQTSPDERTSEKSSPVVLSDATKFKLDMINPFVWGNPGSALAAIYKESTRWATEDLKRK